MKKTLVILITLLAMTSFAGTAFALLIDPDNTTEVGGADFTPSTGVTVKVIATTTAYAAQSKHLSGNKCYGTLSTGSELESLDTCAVGDVVNAPTDALTLALGATTPTTP